MLSYLSFCRCKTRHSFLHIRSGLHRFTIAKIQEYRHIQNWEHTWGDECWNWAAEIIEYVEPMQKARLWYRQNATRIDSFFHQFGSFALSTVFFRPRFWEHAIECMGVSDEVKKTFECYKIRNGWESERRKTAKINFIKDRTKCITWLCQCTDQYTQLAQHTHIFVGHLIDQRQEIQFTIPDEQRHKICAQHIKLFFVHKLFAAFIFLAHIFFLRRCLHWQSFLVCIGKRAFAIPGVEIREIEWPIFNFFSR